MKNRLSIIVSVVALTVATIALVITLKPQKGTSFVLIDKVFDAYTMKKEYEIKLNDIYSQKKLVLDSIEIKLNSEKDENAQRLLEEELNYQKELINEDYERLSLSLNNKVWDSINEKLKAYCETKEVNLFLGINSKNTFVKDNGDADMTDDFIKFLNTSYQKHE